MAEAQKQKKKVVILDDSPEVISIFTTIIRISGYEPIPLMDSMLALKQIVEVQPDVIITDAMMPGRDGFELSYILKNDERTSHIPIIMVTALPGKYEGLAARAKADFYISKPCHPKELSEKLLEILGE